MVRDPEDIPLNGMESQPRRRNPYTLLFELLFLAVMFIQFMLVLYTNTCNEPMCQDGTALRTRLRCRLDEMEVPTDRGFCRDGSEAYKIYSCDPDKSIAKVDNKCREGVTWAHLLFGFFFYPSIIWMISRNARERT